MGIVRALIKWTAITIGIAIVSVIGLAVALWLSPDDPMRVYAVVAGTLGVSALILRALFPDGDDRPA